METTRERIVAELRAESLSATELSRRFDVPTAVVYDHVRHVTRSLASADEELLVAPPSCRDCGFDDFDDPLGAPTRCPECKTEGLDEAVFTIE